jgi:hypothetical protein
MARQLRFQRRPAAVCVAVLAVLLVALTVCLLLRAAPPSAPAHSAHRVAGEPRQPALTTRPVPRREVSPAGSVGPEASPAIDLQQIRWMNDDGCELPVSLVAGPHDTTGGFASGYADTPLGALLAADNIAVRTSWEFGSQVFAPVIEDQVTGQYQPDLYSSAIAGWESADGQLPAGAICGRQLGFEWQDYTPQSATVNLLQSAIVNGSVTYAATEVQVQWSSGDWQVVAPDSGDWANATVQVTSLTGYTLFPGQGS